MQTLEKKETKGKKNNDDIETKSNDSFDDEIEAVSKPVNLEDDDKKTVVEEDDNNEEETGKSSKKKSKTPYIEIIAKQEKLEFELSSGNYNFY
jgi:hypothetical protein